MADQANAYMVAEIDELQWLIDEKADQGTREPEICHMYKDEISTLRPELNDTTAELEVLRRAPIDAEE